MQFADVLDLLYQSGPVCAGVLFGTGWCFWLDAVALSPEHTPALWWFPGVVATLALIMMSAVRRSDLQPGYDMDGLQSQKRLWLLVSYLVSFGGLGWAIAGLIVYFRDHDLYTGACGVIQCVCILLSALVYFVTRGQGDGY